MQEVFLLQNQSGFFLSKQQEWVDGRQPNTLYRSAHKDDAINTKVELTVKSAELRITLVNYPTNERGIPQIPSEHLPSVPEPATGSEAAHTPDTIEKNSTSFEQDNTSPHTQEDQ